MKNILILTDFSENATLAAKYAVLLAGKLNAENISFLHANQSVEAITSSPMVTITFEEIHEDAVRQMKQWKSEILNEIPPSTNVHFLIEHMNLESGLNKVIEDHNIDLVVMGITGKTGWEKVIIGSNAIRVLENCKKPLLVIPTSTHAGLPNRILLATDFKDVKSKLDSILLEEFLTKMSASLDVINVSEGEGDFVDLRQEMKDIFSVLDKFKPEFHYKTSTDVAEEINLFAIEHRSELIITFHQRSNWFVNLFRNSISKKLAWHTQVPLLVIPVE
ncbi:universal stress protein [Polluticaenibacter yanchengensis]|uniref:Universal stress protein n=1 Tax=Polluticaenibacter yanchengensis TaxID=3014562 RepID=A0ABT4UPR8_9BACT|nr:universal stress protein [Chitinophagaceae bacterium LY-5]